MRSNSSNKIPSGIPYIVGNEAAERFSYYGMKVILIIFMTDHLRMTEGSANEWYHTFSAAVYALPLLGALLADVFLGKYRTILWLSIVYCFGHVVLAMYETKTGLAVGLGLIAFGSGGIKPCVSAHVGDQFTAKNRHLLGTVFNYFYLAINFGSLISTFATPILLKIYGPSIAFGIPGALMILATFIFWIGRHDFVHVQPSGFAFIKRLISKEGLSIIGRLSIIYLFIAFFWALFDQTGSTWVTQAKSGLMDKNINFLGYTFELLPSQIQVINPTLVLFLVPIFTAFIYPSLNKVIALKPLRKIAIGLILASTSFIIIGLAEEKITAGIEVSVIYQIIAYLLLTAAEIMVSITALEFSYSQAPNEMKSFIMSAYLFSVSLGNLVTVGVNHFIIDPIAIESIQVDEKTINITTNQNISRGEKININENIGLSIVVNHQEEPLVGTFLIGDLSGRSFTLWDTNRKPLTVLGQYTSHSANTFSLYSLKGASYFYFFAVMIFIVGVIFTFVGEKYKGTTYIQKETDNH